MVGPRNGRWEAEEEGTGQFDPHNVGLVVLGTFILWFGWYGFNCGSTLAFSDVGTATTGALVAMNTTIAAAMGGLTVFLLRLRTGRKDLDGMCNGILAGLVAVCAGVGDVLPGMALLIGIAGAIFYEIGHGLLLRPLLSMSGAKGDMFTAHIVGMLVIMGWCGILSLIVFGGLKAAGKLRITDEDQLIGTDSVEISPSMAYRKRSKD